MNGPAAEMLGEIYLMEGRNSEALHVLLPQVPLTAGGGLSVNIAIAYCRLRDYKNAKRFFPNQGLERIFSSREGAGNFKKDLPSPLDMPGERDLRSLESSALLVRGLNAAATGDHTGALKDFLAAERLVPRNPFAAYQVAGMYVKSQTAADQALPRYALVASRAHEPLASEAKRRIEGLKAWFYQHPSDKIKVKQVGDHLEFTQLPGKSP